MTKQEIKTMFAKAVVNTMGDWDIIDRANPEEIVDIVIDNVMYEDNIAFNEDDGADFEYYMSQWDARDDEDVANMAKAMIEPEALDA